MTQPRPAECPACGHERIALRSQRLETEPLTLRAETTEWICQLCRYTWTRPGASRTAVREIE